MIIANDKEDAAYFLNDLEQFLPKTNISFFPDSFKRPLFFEEIDPFQVQQRIESIDKLFSETKHIVVSYPEALFEKMVSNKELDIARIEFVTGEVIDMDHTIDKLVQYGFERVDFVYEPGQFSLRGGIVDLFSFASDLPYRIELDDIVVETIRTFDTQSQLSIQKIGKFTIIPNVNSDYENNEKLSLFELLSEDTIIWIKDDLNLLDRLQISFESAEKFGEKMLHYEEDRLVSMIRDRAFVYPQTIISELKKFSQVYFGTNDTRTTSSPSSQQQTTAQY